MTLLGKEMACTGHGYVAVSGDSVSMRIDLLVPLRERGSAPLIAEICERGRTGSVLLMSRPVRK